MSNGKEIWQIYFPAKVRKAKDNLPEEITFAFLALVTALKMDGPLQTRRRHFGKIEGRKDTWHCHLNSGRPTYVVIWKILDRTQKIIEVLYVGTHENAPY